jgi:orotidine-5'-phosphate decarboxylase
MMETARERLEAKSHRPLLVAVTILTSLTGEEIHEIGFSGDPAENVSRLAKLTQQAGLDGVVCSPRESEMLRRDLGSDFLLVTPGVRPKQATQDDQRRVMTPADAIKAGSSYLVVGRPITGAADPIQALQSINHEISANL